MLSIEFGFITEEGHILMLSVLHIKRNREEGGKNIQKMDYSHRQQCLDTTPGWHSCVSSLRDLCWTGRLSQVSVKQLSPDSSQLTCNTFPMALHILSTDWNFTNPHLWTLTRSELCIGVTEDTFTIGHLQVKLEVVESIHQ